MNEREMMAAIERIATTKIDKSHDAGSAVRAALKRQRWRWVWGASGIAAAITLTAGIGMYMKLAPGSAGGSEENTTAAHGTNAEADTSDEAFQKWAAPYEALKIPMVSREEAGAWREPPIRPMRWESNL